MRRCIAFLRAWARCLTRERHDESCLYSCSRMSSRERKRFSTDSDSEAFNHNPTDGCLAREMYIDYENCTILFSGNSASACANCLNMRFNQSNQSIIYLPQHNKNIDIYINYNLNINAEQ
jgi:late competence protein required for DNA uptake (superfamily II DNA/RNA helicase)